MATGDLITNKGKNVALYRTYTLNGSLSSTEYLPATKFKVGINNSTPNIADTDLDNVIPIDNGTVNDDGDNQLTGSNGGSNTTDNTSTYKQGCNVTDDTAQDLLATTGNATKTWTISNLATNGTIIDKTKYGSIWLYIKDSTALAKFKSAGTCVELRLGSGASDYFYKQWEASDLAVGWNWLYTEGVAIEDLDETGTVSGDVDYFEIEITTNNADDTFTTGDVVYDLLRTWDDDDERRDFVSGYPTLDFTNNEATTRCRIPTTMGNGFLTDGFCTINEDTTELMLSESTVDDESKSRTDEFIYVTKDRFI